MSIGSSLGIEDVPLLPLPVFGINPPSIMKSVDEDIDDQAREDIDYARKNLYEFIEYGKSALTSSLALAQQSENSKCFEAFAAILKNVSEANKQIVDIQEQKHRIRGPKEATKTINNNALFVGSTNELVKMLKDLNK